MRRFATTARDFIQMKFVTAVEGQQSTCLAAHKHGSLECDRTNGRTGGQKCCNKDGALHLGLALTSYLGIPELK